VAVGLLDTWLLYRFFTGALAPNVSYASDTSDFSIPSVHPPRRDPRPSP
jgi:hypothetical protein